MTGPTPPAMSTLLPRSIELARGAVPVADSLTVKGRPGHSTRARPQELVQLGHIWRRTGVLAHVGVGPDEAYMLIDKRHPHAQREIMAMSAGDRLRSGLHEHSLAFAKALGAMTVAFAEHCDQTGLYPVLSWSYDPATIDRESIQGEKRFHAHLIAHTATDLDRVRQLTSPASRYPIARRRRTVDEASVLGAMLAADCMPQLRLLQVVKPLSTPQATCSLQFRVPGGWSAFTSPAIFADLCAVHRVLRRIYGAIADACLTGQAAKWHRPTVDASQVHAVRLPLSTASRSALAHYLSALRPELLADVAQLADPNNRHRTTHLYPLADLAYSVCFSEHRGHLYGHVRSNVFSDLGGTGVAVMDGTVVKIRKGVGHYDQHELATREAFQRDYLNALRQHPELGPAALYPLLASA